MLVFGVRKHINYYLPDTAKMLHCAIIKTEQIRNLFFIRYPVLYEESLNTVLIQEAIRYNKLLTVIQSTLRDLLKALKGLVVMSEALEKMSLSLFSNIVPGIWASKAYPSLKPLGNLFGCVNARYPIER